MKEINDINLLFNEDLMISDLYEWLDDTPLMKKNFRDASIISGLIERKMPGLTKTSKQNACFLIIYDHYRSENSRGYVNV